MEQPKEKAGRVRDVIKIAALVLAVLLTLQLYAEILRLYETVLQQGQMIETLLQAENDRLERELAQQRTIMTPPAEVTGVSYTQIAIFEPLNISLPEDIQLIVWELCGKHPTFLSQQEFFELVLKVMWNESRYLMDVPDNHNTNGTIDRGPMQINSVNWKWLSAEGLDINEWEENIEAGVRILSEFLNQYQDVEYALTAYGNGPTGAEALGGKSDLATKIINLNLEEVASSG